MTGVRMAPDLTAALDAAAAAEPDKPSRSGLIRRIVTEWLHARDLTPAVGSDILNHEDAERRQRANVDASRRSARTRKGKG